MKLLALSHDGAAHCFDAQNLQVDCHGPLEKGIQLSKQQRQVVTCPPNVSSCSRLHRDFLGLEIHILRQIQVVSKSL